MIRIKSSLIFLLTLGFIFAGPDYGIFEKILNATGSFEETTSAFETALDESNLTLHSKYDFNSSNTGGQKSRLYVLTSPSYIKAAENEEPNTVSAQVLRVAIYEYGKGRKTYINMTNPIAHAMVFYEDSKSYKTLVENAKSVGAEIKAVVAKVPGQVVSEQQPPLRDEDDLNDFNGDGPAKMMAMWKNWEESQDELFDEKTMEAAVVRVEQTIKGSEDAGTEDCIGWRITSKIEFKDAVYFGITNEYTENRTTSINSDFRSNGKSDDAPLPGIDHASAHPMEIIVYKDGRNIKAIQYGQMWRMQLYYWDSGYAAFAKYTMIPGIISGSIEDLFED
ncbi:MAG: hypothetical protein QF769_03415 [Candidatus Marinimicrobia bacterium]|jgi:hypothetical protein|nr:hypothetical protein [Candidatus Neomarinimicrobiota bacterium]|tara:strand:+ start:3080 stop:4084 length:1005 start_codon:yes stop_codon:yes gene_type:complete